MPGPAPKPADQRARRNPSLAMTSLPQSGRKGRTPAWPLGSDISLDVAIETLKLEIKTAGENAEWETTARDRAAGRRKVERMRKKLAELQAMRRAASAAEKRIWTALWKTPQATQWEKYGWHRAVALYARHQAKAEAGSLPDSAEARQREDRLGLNDMAMLRLRWTIVDDTSTAASPPPSPQSKQNASRYSHLKVVGS